MDFAPLQSLLTPFTAFTTSPLTHTSLFYLPKEEFLISRNYQFLTSKTFVAIALHTVWHVLLYLYVFRGVWWCVFGEGFLANTAAAVLQGFSKNEDGFISMKKSLRRQFYFLAGTAIPLGVYSQWKFENEVFSEDFFEVFQKTKAPREIFTEDLILKRDSPDTRDFDRQKTLQLFQQMVQNYVYFPLLMRREAIWQYFLLFVLLPCLAHEMGRTRTASDGFKAGDGNKARYSRNEEVIFNSGEKKQPNLSSQIIYTQKKKENVGTHDEHPKLLGKKGRFCCENLLPAKIGHDTLHSLHSLLYFYAAFNLLVYVLGRQFFTKPQCFSPFSNFLEKNGDVSLYHEIVTVDWMEQLAGLIQGVSPQGTSSDSEVFKAFYESDIRCNYVFPSSSSSSSGNGVGGKFPAAVEVDSNSGKVDSSSSPERGSHGCMFLRCEFVFQKKTQPDAVPGLTLGQGVDDHKRDDEEDLPNYVTDLTVVSFPGNGQTLAANVGISYVSSLCEMFVRFVVSSYTDISSYTSASETSDSHSVEKLFFPVISDKTKFRFTEKTPVGIVVEKGSNNRTYLIEQEEDGFLGDFFAVENRIKLVKSTRRKKSDRKFSSDKKISSSEKVAKVDGKRAPQKVEKDSEGLHRESGKSGKSGKRIRSLTAYTLLYPGYPGNFLYPKRFYPITDMINGGHALLDYVVSLSSASSQSKEVNVRERKGAKGPNLIVHAFSLGALVGAGAVAKYYYAAAAAAASQQGAEREGVHDSIRTFKQPFSSVTLEAPFTSLAEISLQNGRTGPLGYLAWPVLSYWEETYFEAFASPRSENDFPFNSFKEETSIVEYLQGIYELDLANISNLSSSECAADLKNSKFQEIQERDPSLQCIRRKSRAKSGELLLPRFLIVRKGDDYVTDTEKHTQVGELLGRLKGALREKILEEKLEYNTIFEDNVEDNVETHTAFKVSMVSMEEATHRDTLFDLRAHSDWRDRDSFWWQYEDFVMGNL